MTTLEQIHILAVALERNVRFAMTCDEGLPVFEAEIVKIMKELNQLLK